MPKSSLQVLFVDREQLQLQTLASSVGAFGARVIEKLAESSIGPNTPLLRLCEAWFDVVSDPGCSGGCLLTSAISDYRGRHGAIPNALRQGQQLWTEALRRAADSGLQSGELPPSTDLDQLIFELQAFQGSANIAAFSRDERALMLARQAVRKRLKQGS
ncbi:hypothetical protein [Rhizobium sp. BK376]|uniref:TetR family transcriptional regulator C-terminal domain-containing protein n=1 Tax=Rhizobium sp. BK376 TaxID=2512149 RepID=UPI0010E08223|nr:TetR family transcriptional regulator [Rhizobium sp. BK376]